LKVSRKGESVRRRRGKDKGGVEKRRDERERRGAEERRRKGREVKHSYAWHSNA
jgi:hypothetical protein